MPLQAEKSHVHLFAVLCSAIFIFLHSTLGVHLGNEAPLILLILPVFMSAFYGGLGPGVLSTIACLAGGTPYDPKPRPAFGKPKRGTAAKRNKVPTPWNDHITKLISPRHWSRP